MLIANVIAHHYGSQLRIKVFAVSNKLYRNRISRRHGCNNEMTNINTLVLYHKKFAFSVSISTSRIHEQKSKNTTAMHISSYSNSTFAQKKT